MNTPRPAETQVFPEMLLVPTSDGRELLIPCNSVRHATPENRDCRNRLPAKCPSSQSGCQMNPNDRVPATSPIFRNGCRKSFDYRRERRAPQPLLAMCCHSPGPVFAPACCRSVAALHRIHWVDAGERKSPVSDTEAVAITDLARGILSLRIVTEIVSERWPVARGIRVSKTFNNVVVVVPGKAVRPICINFARMNA